jgi:ABC-type dipeptide/oligopeptide/nickel transport system ATPase component
MPSNLRICYIWIESFRNFQNFSFNISGKTKFYFDAEKNILSRINTDILTPNFFGDTITDVIGIIGKNGAGKSNAIELICHVLKGSRNYFKSDYMLVTEEDGVFTCHVSFFSNRDMPTSNEVISFEIYQGSLNSIKIVYFSNVYNNRKIAFSKDVADISVNSSLYSNFNKLKHLSNFKKEIQLINSKLFSSLNIELPSSIQIISKVWTSRYNSSQMYDIYKEISGTVRDFKKFFRDRLRDIKGEKKFSYLIIYGFFFDKIDQVLKEQRRIPIPPLLLKELAEFLNFQMRLRTDIIVENLLDFLDFGLAEQIESLKGIDIELDNISNLVPNDKTGIQQQIKFLRQLGEHHVLNRSVEGTRSRELETFTLSYSNTDSKNFADEFVSLFESESFLDISWLGISSGHRAYLNLFASIYNELRFSKQDNLFLCIDEGDLYLHPKWQVEFFGKLLYLLPLIFKGNIQLALTSHSPFLLSDLPNQNLTILQDGESINGIDLQVKTFGGNLYNLYAEPFFLGSVRTSDFAAKKIRAALDGLEVDGQSKGDRRALVELSTIIGDEVLEFRIKNILKND